MSCAPQGAYRARKPRESPLWRLLDRHFPQFLADYEERYAKTYGPLRSVVERAVGEYLKCGILECGFARVRCPECGDEYLLAFSCKRRCLCPSCHKKRQIEFGEFVSGTILEAVPHRHVTLSVPRRLRPFFRRDRKRLAQLARAAHATVREVLEEAADFGKGVPGAVASMQSYGSLLDWHPHIHLLASWGLFAADGTFTAVAEVPDAVALEKLFRHQVLKMLQEEGAIGEDVIRNMLGWKHTGFGAHVGPEIAATDGRARENVSRYLAHAPVVLGRIVGGEGAASVIYRSDTIHPRHAANFRTFEPLDFIAEVVSHIPDANEKMQLFYGWYSNRTRGHRRAQGLLPAAAPAADPAAESDRAPIEVRKNWARLIRKIYEVDPLACPRCGAEMKVIAVIEDPDVVERILTHLELLPAAGDRAPPGAEASSPAEAVGKGKELVYEAFYDDLQFGEPE